MTGASPIGDRAGGLRPEPAAQSQPKALIPSADVTPADREAAWAFMRSITSQYGDPIFDERLVKLGRNDDHRYVQAFARHRLSQDTIYVQWSDDGQHIRKWSREPFEGSAATPAQGIEAAKADETRSGSAVGESPVAESDAPETPLSTPLPSGSIER